MTRLSSGRSVFLLLAASAVLTGCQEQHKFAIEPPTKYGGGATDPTKTATEGQTSGGEATTTAGAATDAGAAGVTPGTTPPSTIDPGANTTSTTPPSTTDATKPPPITAPTGGPAVALKFAFDKGSELKFKSSLESTSPTMGGTATGKPIITSSTTTAKVVDVTGGTARIEMTVSNMVMSGGSDIPEAQKAMQKMAKDAEGAKISQVFDATGKPSGLKYLKGSSMQATLAGLNLDTGFFGLTYPTNSVKPGDTWTHAVDYKTIMGSSFGPMASQATWTNSNVTTVFTLQSVDQASGIATIGISAKGNPSVSMKMPVRQTPPGGKAGQTPPEMKMSITVNGSGTAMVDIRSGIPKQIDYQMETSFTNPMGSGTMSQKTKGTLKRL